MKEPLNDFSKQIYLNVFVRVTQVVMIISGLTVLALSTLALLKLSSTLDRAKFDLPLAALVVVSWRVTYLLVNAQFQIKESQRVIRNFNARLLNALISIVLLVSMVLYKSYPEKVFLRHFHFIFSNAITIAYVVLYIMAFRTIEKWNIDRDSWPFNWFS